jgi:hypothetical protein
VPAETPVTIPVDAPTVAIDVLADVHDPPELASDKVIVLPAHTLADPDIAAGGAATVMIVVALPPDVV